MTEKPLSIVVSAPDFGSGDTGSTPVGAANEELFLILHKVRGEPALDIAVKEWYGEQEGWMLKTTEQRCWPYQWWKVEDLFDGSDYPHSHPYTHIDKYIPDDLPDFHFQPPPVSLEDRPGHREFRPAAVADLLSKLGMESKRPKLIRRPYKT